MKGDAFEKMTYMPDQSMEDMERWAANLLRQHHAKILRLVARHARQHSSMYHQTAKGLHAQGAMEACEELLAELDRMAKEGKP